MRADGATAPGASWRLRGELVLRALAAFECGAHMADLVAEGEDARRWRAQVDLIGSTLDSRGWKDDHYVVSLQQPQPTVASTPRYGGPGGGYNGGYEGEVGGGAWNDPDAGPAWNGGGQGYSRSSSASVAGWDAYSIYATNGMLYPMQSGFRLPGRDLKRMR